jgi:5-methylcytosine-specific restriction endonuclease McrA
MAQAVAALNDYVPGWRSLDADDGEPIAGASVSRRRGLPPRVRWVILQRDGFTCLYCGAKAPYVELQVDHVIAKVNGGTDDPSNLVTTCRDCNAGKGSLSIGTKAPQVVAQDNV